MATHQTLGIAVLLMVVLRMAWLSQSPAPPMRADLHFWQRQLARATHVGLYALMLAFPVTGVLLTAWRGEVLDIYGWSVTGLLAPNAELAAVVAFLHNLALPTLFYLAIFMHLGAVTKHHFGECRLRDVRRMLR
jgi:cytochrome b561